MTRILIFGGYGGFGSRLSRRLAKQGHNLLVAGRHLESATRFCDSIAGATPIQADRNADITPVLQEHRPDLVIDAAGPFQNSDYCLVESCIANAVSYIDLADARDFVIGIDQFDLSAQAADSVVISGASSVPGLSRAVIDHLSADMDRVSQIEIAISASSRATIGRSVAQAILSGVGKPVKLWIGRRWETRCGWSLLQKRMFRLPDGAGLKRTIALVDVPDHDIFPTMVQGKPSVIFRAGPEFGFQTRVLQVLGWLVKAGWLGSLRGLAAVLQPVQRLFAPFGSRDSAMQVAVKGWVQDKALQRIWTLIAREDCGPEIPVLAAELLVAEWARKNLKSGARTCAGQVDLAQFQSKFDGLAIETGTEERAYVPLYQRVMGPRFTKLSAPVQKMHRLIGDGGASGTAEVKRGRSLAARFVATLMRFPPAGEHDLHVSFTEVDGKERWRRQFGRHGFASELSQTGVHLVERFGMLRFFFDLREDDGSLQMVMRKWTFLSIPLPLFLAPRSPAREYADEDHFCFDVPISLPVIGLVVHYRGRLTPH